MAGTVSPRGERRSTVGMLMKIRLVDQQKSAELLYRTLECDPNSPVSNLIKDLKEKYHYEDSSDLEWGLFYPAPGSNRTGSMAEVDAGTPQEALTRLKDGQKDCEANMSLDDSSDGETGTWLDNSATLASHGLPQMASLEFRNAMRLFTITDLESNLSKTMRVSNIDNVQNLLREVAVRFSITNLELYALQVLRGKQHIWLNPERRLSDQLTNVDERMVLRQRYFSCDDIESDDPYALHFMYLECREGVVKGNHPCTLQQALNFAALQMQITYRDYDALVHVSGFLTTDDFLPPSHRDIMLIEEDIYKEHRKLKGLAETDAKLRYCKTLISFPTYGVTLIPAKEKTEINYDRDLLVGIKSDALLCLHPVTKLVLFKYPFHQIDGLYPQKRKLQWNFVNGATPRQFEMETALDVNQFVELFTAYRRLMQRPSSFVSVLDMANSNPDEIAAQLAATFSPSIDETLPDGKSSSSRKKNS